MSKIGDQLLTIGVALSIFPTVYEEWARPQTMGSMSIDALVVRVARIAKGLVREIRR